MNQTRVFLIFAWLMVATLLWMEWGKERDVARAPRPAVATVPAGMDGAPGAVPQAGQQGPAVPSATPGMPAASAQATGSDPVVTVATDVLRLEMTGGEIRQADLLELPQRGRR